MVVERAERTNFTTGFSDLVVVGAQEASRACSLFGKGVCTDWTCCRVVRATGCTNGAYGTTGAIEATGVIVGSIVPGRASFARGCLSEGV